MQNTSQLIKDTVFQKTKPFDDAAARLPFGKHNIDSFDLLTLRIEIEKILGKSIPDSEWTSFRTFQQVFDFCQIPDSVPAAKTSGTAARHLQINMPQMSVGGLSESWLFKEAGDFHWAKLAAALQKLSNEISDEAGNRLYATFLRFRYTATNTLAEFAENDPLSIDNTLSRFGKGIFFSLCQFESKGRVIAAELMSSFTARVGSNKDLMKGDPILPANFSVNDSASMPDFGAGYRDMRKSLQQQHALANETIPLTADVLFQCRYDINPFADVNGVNLIYFAAYPVIADICERRYVHENRKAFSYKTDYAMDVSVLAKDIFYFGNLDVTDHIIYELNSFEVKGSKVLTQASLFRGSDKALIAKIFSIKQRVN
jgi:probable biosynthetic protein (TIGR04098 family)